MVHLAAPFRSDQLPWYIETKTGHTSDDMQSLESSKIKGIEMPV
jgi:hypothetical protein